MAKLIKRQIKFAKKGTSITLELIVPVIFGEKYNHLSLKQKDRIAALYKADPTAMNLMYLSILANNREAEFNLALTYPNLSTFIVEDKLNPKTITTEIVEPNLEYKLKLVSKIKGNETPMQKAKSKVKKNANNTKWKYQRNLVNKLFGTNFNSPEDVAIFLYLNGIGTEGMVGEETLLTLNNKYGKNIKFDLIKYIIPKSEDKKEETKDNKPKILTPSDQVHNLDSIPKTVTVTGTETSIPKTVTVTGTGTETSTVNRNRNSSTATSNNSNYNSITKRLSYDGNNNFYFDGEKVSNVRKLNGIKGRILYEFEDNQGNLISYDPYYNSTFNKSKENNNEENNIYSYDDFASLRRIENPNELSFNSFKDAISLFLSGYSTVNDEVKAYGKKLARKLWKSGKKIICKYPFYNDANRTVTYGDIIKKGLGYVLVYKGKEYPLKQKLSPGGKYYEIGLEQSDGTFRTYAKVLS